MSNYTELVKALRKEQERVIELQAEVKRLTECNDELREKQTFIDNWGTRWGTSAKDVPTSAYQHGYADGFHEAEQQLPKRGEWYCYTCKYLDKKPLEECGYGKCRLCDIEVEAIHDWGCMAWAKMEVQDADE